MLELIFSALMLMVKLWDTGMFYKKYLKSLQMKTAYLITDCKVYTNRHKFYVLIYVNHVKKKLYLIKT